MACDESVITHNQAGAFSFLKQEKERKSKVPSSHFLYFPPFPFVLQAKVIEVDKNAARARWGSRQGEEREDNIIPGSRSVLLGQI